MVLSVPSVLSQIIFFLRREEKCYLTHNMKNMQYMEPRKTLVGRGTKMWYQTKAKCKKIESLLMQRITAPP